MQYKVTQHEGTEPPFQNEYADNKKEGIYVDIVSGNPFSAQRTSLSPVPAGRVSQSLLNWAIL